jgi:D-3-phosphoglycerate dehydrogenase
MLGRVGTALGEAGINIVSAAVGRRPEDGDEAAMLVTADAPIPQRTVDAIASTEGFVAGRTVSL